MKRSTIQTILRLASWSQRYKAGDWVNPRICNPRKFAGRQDKWTRKFSGPYLGVKPLGLVNLLLQRSKRQRPFTVHIDKVKPFLADEMPRSWMPQSKTNKSVNCRWKNGSSPWRTAWIRRSRASPKNNAEVLIQQSRGCRRGHADRRGRNDGLDDRDVTLTRQ